jgi:hypothetical protein
MTDGTPILLLLLAAACYFLPSLIALMRGKANGTGGVIFVNLLLGWTVAGWIVSFIWACSGTTEADKRREEKRHAELLAAVAATGALPSAQQPAPQQSAAPAGSTVGAVLGPIAAMIAAGIVVIIALAFAYSPAHAQQPSQTRCYQSGPTQVCETKDSTSGAVISQSRCYQSGKDTRCDTQNFSTQTGPTTIPLDRKLTR